MAYASQDDIIELYGEDALFVADRDGDGVPEAAAIARALSSAGDEIDSYLYVRYTLPLSETPSILRQLAVDIALYRLAATRALLSDELRQRYEDALAHLRRIAKGEAALVLPPAEGETAEPERPRPVVSGGPPRLFSRDKTRDL